MVSLMDITFCTDYYFNAASSVQRNIENMFVLSVTFFFEIFFDFTIYPAFFSANLKTFMGSIIDVAVRYIMQPWSQLCKPLYRYLTTKR